MKEALLVWFLVLVVWFIFQEGDDDDTPGGTLIPVRVPSNNQPSVPE